MKRHLNPSKSAVATWLLTAFAMALRATAASDIQSATPEMPIRSVFIIPTSPKEGHDPFFPGSTRVYETAVVAQPQNGDVSLLVLRGISGPSDRRLAIINNHTVGVGDEEDMVTSQGRIHFRCVEIKNNSVVIESAGQRHELFYKESH